MTNGLGATVEETTIGATTKPTFSGTFRGSGPAPTVSISFGPCSRSFARQRLRELAGWSGLARPNLSASLAQFPPLLEQRRYADVIALAVRIEEAFPNESATEAFVRTSYYRGLAERDLGQIEAAFASFRRSRAIAETLGLLGEAGRAMSAEGKIRLKDQRRQERDEGADLVQQAVRMKLQCKHSRRGGIGSDFVALSAYALTENRLSRALGHGRRGLWLSTDEGRAADIIDAQENMVRVYLASRLFNQARDLARSAVAWAGADGTSAFIVRASSLKESVDGAMRKRGKLPRTFICPCPENRSREKAGERPYRFEACCGPADREPLELHFGYCLQPQHGPYRPLPESDLFNFTLGEYVDRKGTPGYPQGFLSGRLHDGWLDTYGLPHLAHYHLHGARAAYAASVGQDVGFPIAAVVLAVCSLEAFVNGVAHIHPGLQEMFKQDREAAASSSGRDESEIVRKWIRAASELCGEDWLSHEHLDAVRSLITLRNNLVHFKPEWELLDDPSGNGRKPGWEQREDALWWPHRLMTKDAGRWAISVAEQLMETFRTNLREECRRIAVSPDRITKRRPSPPQDAGGKHAA